ncbi:MAG: YCF48-related protein [Bacteroidota bacterium]
MLKTLPIFTGLFLLVLGLSAQRTVTQNPVEEITQFEDVFVDAGGNGWAVGSCGIIAKTTNNGMSWTFQDAPEGNDYSTVGCAPGTNCQTVILAGGGLRARSTNGGTSWTVVDDDDNMFGEDIIALGTNVVLYDGGSFFTLRSINGGATWATIELPDSPATPFQFVSATNGYFFGNDEVFYRTTDAGQTWTATSYTHPASVRYLTFFDATTGWLYDNDRKIYKTTDGGMTWTDQQQSGLISNIRVIAAISPTQLRGVSVTDQIWESDDSGTTWTSYALNMGDGIFVKQKYHRIGNEFWLVSNLSEIFYSASNFDNWQSGIDGVRKDIAGIAFTDESTGFFLDEDRNVYRTTNTGDDWNLVAQNIAVAFSYGLEALPDGSLLAIFNAAQPLVSTDQGESWEEYLPTSVQNQMDLGINAFTILPNGRYLFVGPNTTVYSDNQGASWTVFNHEAGLSIREVYFFNNQLGFVMGTGGGRYYRTTDGGLSWTNLTEGSPTSQPVNIAWFSDEDNGILFNGSRSYRTSDGGISWITDTSLPGSYEIERLANGALIANSFGSGNKAEFYWSLDEGATWQNIANTCAPTRTSTVTPNGRYYFAAGDGGNVIRIDLDEVSSNRNPNAVAIQSLKVFPNPTNGFVQLELPELATGEIATLQIIDAQGRVLQQRQLQTDLPTIDLTDYPAGMYAFHLRGQDWLRTGRIIKQ